MNLLHEYLLILYGVITWELLSSFWQKGTLKERLIAFVTDVKNTMGMIGLEVAFDDELLKLFPVEQIPWWVYFGVGFFTDLVIRFFSKPKQ